MEEENSPNSKSTDVNRSAPAFPLELTGEWKLKGEEFLFGVVKMS